LSYEWAGNTKSARKRPLRAILGLTPPDEGFATAGVLVMKFGGSSLANETQLRKVADIVAGRRARRPVVICSAHKGMTDALLHAAQEAAEGRVEPDPVIERQRSITRAVGMPESELEPMIDEIRDTLRGIGLLREVSPRVRDFILSFGERMSVRTMAHVLRETAVPAQAFDAPDLGFVTDAHHGTARPLPDTPRSIREAFGRCVPDDVVPVVTGFIGRTAAGDITTVGRNGSDYSATVFASALGAEECEIWTDTDGVMSADPNLVPGARNIPSMSFAEASELARYGGRVLHPSTLLPAVERDIPVRVMNTNRPQHRGTVITRSPDGDPEAAITSIAYKEHQTVLTIESTTMLGQPGFLAQVFDRLGRAGIDIDMISTSEVTVSMTTREALDDPELLRELESFGRVEVARHRSLICVVGRTLRTEPGVASAVFAALAAAGVNVEMISHGANNINLSLMVRDEDVAQAVPALHAAFFR
jgi:aspartate kinase